VHATQQGCAHTVVSPSLMQLLRCVCVLCGLVCVCVCACHAASVCTHCGFNSTNAAAKCVHASSLLGMVDQIYICGTLCVHAAQQRCAHCGVNETIAIALVATQEMTAHCG